MFRRRPILDADGHFSNEIRYFRVPIADAHVLLRPAATPDVNLFWGWQWGNFCLFPKAGDTPTMPLKELEIRYAAKRQRPYKLSDGGGLQDRKSTRLNSSH